MATTTVERHYFLMAPTPETHRRPTGTGNAHLAHVAETVRWLRQQREFTQEDLAAAAHLDVRTIAYVESGRRGSSKETLQRIAKVFGVPDSFFNAPTPEQVERFEHDTRREIRKSVLTDVHAVTDAGDVMDLAPSHLQRSDMSSVTSDDARAIGAEIVDAFTDYMDVGGEISMVQRLELARGIAADCERLRAHGYTCYVGQHREVLSPAALPSGALHPNPGGEQLVFRSAVIVMLPSSTGPKHRVLVRLDGPWETHPDDRAHVPGLAT